VEVVRELVLPAPPEEVWEALTAPERLEEWFANDVELDLEGGQGVFRWASGETRRALIEEVEVGRRLGLRWWDEEVGETEPTQVTFTLEEVDEGTRLVVREASPGPTACACEWFWAIHFQPMFLARSAAA
jgi:uncharacterized protein YndB with AHSA1/START domain